MPQFLEFKLISGWPHDRYVPFLGEYLRFAESQPNKRKYQKWCRTKRLFDREALEFFNRLLGVRVGARKIQCDEIGEELLEELAKVKSDADLDYGPTMTDDGRRILAIDAETVSRARNSQDNSFLSSLFDRFVELNGYLARFIITEVGDGFLAENELMKRIQAGIYKGARPNVNQLKYWIEWMLILGIMIKVGFRFKLTARGLEQLEYLKNIPEAELLEAADEDDEDEDDEDEDDEDGDGEEDERPKAKSKTSKAPEAPKPPARAAPKDDDDDGDDLDDDDGPPAKGAKPKKTARGDDDEDGDDDDLDDEDEDEDEDALDEEGLEMPPEPGSIDHRGLDPREEALLATLDTAPAAVTGLKLALAPAMTALENLHSEIKEEIEAAKTAARAAAEAAEERPRRKPKPAAKPAAGAKKRRSVVEIEDLGDAVSEAVQDFGDEDLDAESAASAELEAPSDDVATLAAEDAPVEPDFGQVIGRLRSLIRERSRPALDDALRVLQDAAAAAPSAQPGYAESPPPALAQNRERILRWWGNHPARAVFTAPELGIKAAPEGEETLFVLAVAAEVLATPAAGAHKVAFFQKIHAAGLLGAYYRGESSLEDLLESCGLLSPETVGAPVFSALLALPKFRRACRRGALDAVKAAKASREVVEALHKSLGARLGPSLIWLLREGRRLELLAPEDGARYEAVPDAEALETAYRLGFVSTHYSGGLDSLLQLSEKISLYFRQAEDGESPLALFAQAHGCRFHCPWTLRCPYACREKSLPPSFL